MSDIATNLKILRDRVPPAVKIVAVSKTKPAGDILEAYNSGQRIFGENKVQEILSKKDSLPCDIEWHMIGHLQTNKVKSIVPFIRMIQSVDSMKLLSVINTESNKLGKVMDCLLQVHIAEEETKFGFSFEELKDALQSAEYSAMQNIRICGLMGMATFTDDTEQVRKEFRNLASYFNNLKEIYFNNNLYFKDLSMGMSGDFEIGISEGSTMIRVGSLIFGGRNKTAK
jgi:pyridoxal phosphate enzyme (YggS family)